MKDSLCDFFVFKLTALITGNIAVEHSSPLELPGL